MRKFHIGLATVTGAALLSYAAVQAADEPAAAPDPSRVSGGTYTVDSGHSLVGWKVNHIGINDYFGLFGDVKGTLKLDPANISASEVEVTIPVSKVLTASPRLTEELVHEAGKDGAPAPFFGPDPADAVFKSTQVRPAGGNQALITGMLTLNGVTKPVSIMAELSGAGINGYSKKENIGFHGWGEINRSDFGVNGALPGTSDKVRLDITIAFTK